MEGRFMMFAQDYRYPSFAKDDFMVRFDDWEDAEDVFDEWNIDRDVVIFYDIENDVWEQVILEGLQKEMRLEHIKEMFIKMFKS